MNRIFMLLTAVAGVLSLSAAMPRSEWLAKVGDSALDSNVLKATMTQLSSEDKTAFLAEVNAAIGKMPGSADAKAARFLAANRAAVAAAGSADRAAVLAEVYATVQPEALTVINEEFAKNEFSRPATMTDAEYLAIVSAVMKRIVQRTATSEAGAVRAGFAGLMFIRAAGAVADDATVAVVASLPSDSQTVAKDMWFPSALGKDGVATYDPMLASAQAGEEPNPEVVLDIVPMQTIESMLGDLQRGGTKWDIPAIPGTAIRTIDPMNGSLSAFPRHKVLDRDSPYYSKDRDHPRRDPNPEPGPYWMQNL